jgi:hypothetical protein
LDQPHLTQDEAATLAVEAYVFLYPLVIMEMTRRQMTNVPADALPGAGPANEFHHFRAFPEAEFRSVVRPNFDTLYSSAFLELAAGPQVVSAPDTAGRYYLLPMLDMWTDVFAVPGKRTTGTAEGHFAVVPPGFDGNVPAGLETIQATTPGVWIIGRTQTNGPDDYEAVHAVQAGYRVTPLADWPGEAAPGSVTPDPAIDMKTPPPEQAAALTGPEFFALAADLMGIHPPHASDWSQLARLSRIGIAPGSFDQQSLSADVRAASEAAPEAAMGLIRAAQMRLAPRVNGWQIMTENVGVYGNSYLRRAAIALAGLGANPAEDAVYPILTSDADGNPLDGSSNYVMHFDSDKLPPVDAFWSVAMYDGEGYQAANELNRFAIGDRDPLHYNADGSLGLYLQQGNPGPEREANWLPAPPGLLGVTMRLYAPRPEVLDGGWAPPPAAKTA